MPEFPENRAVCPEAQDKIFPEDGQAPRRMKNRGRRWKRIIAEQKKTAKKAEEVASQS